MTHKNELLETGERDGKSRRGVKRVAVLLGCGLVLGVLGLSGFWHLTDNEKDYATVIEDYYYTAHDRGFNSAGDKFYATLDMSPVAHVIGGRRFVIPKAYIHNSQQRSPSGKTDYLEMSAMLRDMSPYSKDNAHLFNPFHPEHLYTLYNLVSVPDGAKGSYDWLTPEEIGGCTVLEAGFRVCPTPVEDVRILTSADGKKRYLFRCTDEYMGIPPSCDGVFPLVANVELQIIFHPRYMKEIKRYIAAAFHRVCSFYRPAPSETLEFDHCHDDEYLEPGVD